MVGCKAFFVSKKYDLTKAGLTSGLNIRILAAFLRILGGSNYGNNHLY